VKNLIHQSDSSATRPLGTKKSARFYGEPKKQSEMALTPPDGLSFRDAHKGTPFGIKQSSPNKLGRGQRRKRGSAKNVAATAAAPRRIAPKSKYQDSSTADDEVSSEDTSPVIKRRRTMAEKICNEQVTVPKSNKRASNKEN
jgi:hypothetical protein